MKTKCSALLAIVTGWLLLGSIQISVAQSVPPVKIILDTDMAADCDDLGAVAVLHALASQGKADILGMVCNVSDPNTPLCLSAINTYYGRPNIPIGYLNDSSVSPFVTFPYLYLNEYTDYIADTNHYPRNFVTNEVPDALDVYMQLLRTNSGVTIVSIGSFYNLDKLLSADRELVRTNVAKLVVMGGKYPPEQEMCPYFDFNFSLARDAAMRVVSNWPTPIVFTGLGDHVITGTNLFDDAKVASDNPIRWGYDYGTRNGHPDNGMTPNAKERPSWDPITVLYAVEGTTTNFVEVGNGGTNVIEECLLLFAINCWSDGAGNNHGYLTQLVSDDVLAARIEELMTEQPIPRAPSNLSAIVISTNEIDLTWQRNANNEDEYDIERSTDGINFDEIGFTMGEIITSFADDTGLNPCTTYYYRVRAYNASGDSDYSNVAGATTGCGLTDGLVAYYPFDGNANDFAGTNNAVVDGAVLTSDRFGNSNHAYYFDGVSKIQLSNQVPLQPQSSFTYAIWIYNAADLYDNAWFIDRVEGDPMNSIVGLTATGSSDSGYAFNVRYDDYTYPPNWFVYFGHRKLNAWQHVAMVREYGNAFKLYLDGVLVGSGADNGKGVTAKITRLGYLLGQNIPSLVGKMDDFRIYNRALSANEIQQLYVAEGGLNAGLVAYYPFDGNANDESGRGHDGTTYGPVLTADRFGQTNQAYWFSGADDCWMSITDATRELNFDVKTQPFTVSVWVMPASLPVNNDMHIIMDRSGSDNQPTSYDIFYRGYFGGYFMVDAWCGINSEVDSETIPVVGNWYHIVVVNNTQRLQLFVNGRHERGVNSYDDPFPLNYSSTLNSYTIRSVGKFWPSSALPNQTFNGAIDDIRIYNRALSASEVAQLYMLGLPILGAACQGSNLVLLWPTNVPTFTLVSSTNLGPSAVWTPVSPAPVVVNGQFFVTNSLSEPSMFFRLRGL